MYMTILIIALPVIAVILALVFVFSGRGGQITDDKKKIDMKMNELEQELKKRKQQDSENTVSMD